MRASAQVCKFSLCVKSNFSILQTGTIALTSEREEALTLSSTSGRIDRWGLTPGEFKSSLTRANILPRTVDGTQVVTATPLQDGDLTINGVAVGASSADDDTLSTTGFETVTLAMPVLANTKTFKFDGVKF